MVEDILIYDVQSGETLDTIGQKVGMTGDQLKEFHNANCEKMDKLWFNNLVGVRQIIIPKEYKNPEEVRKEKAKELPPASVTRDFYAKKYNIKESFSGLTENTFELEYSVDVNFRNKENNLPEEIAEVRCYDFKKNDNTPDDKMSSVALACMESIYPIAFLVPMQGKISGIYLFEDLKKRFDNKRPDLEDFYVGEVYQKYLNKFNQSLSNEEFTVKQLSSTLLYQLLFPKMEWFHKTGNWTEAFYLIQNSFKIKCEMSAEYDHTDSEMVQTFIRGNISDPLSLQELLRGVRFDKEPEEPADGEIDFRYTTNKFTKKMTEAEVSLVLKTDNELYSKQILKLTQNAQ
ncbi:hypothetical protein ASG01_00460 [Chryseobacterium sp. Leaf180]|uniref:hypothetical protein n=1 Tax=Chryseobacterium sp. Leaf180 TaxID=1736289 RepID=UPI0006FBE87D|nr:hypothetical protein [Chryseobacterium sp. Leaf180]KQR94395.1 hypothetical protein ASG01_00460 [Chryseobacterium sp. Leaf180]